MNPAPRKGLRHVSDIITDILEDPLVAESSKESIREGVRCPSMHCPCPECMRAYLRAVEKGEAA